MAETNPQETRFLQVAGRIANWNIDTLLGSPNSFFATSRSLFEAIIEFYKEAASVRFREIPAPVLDTMAANADGVVQALQRVESFDTSTHQLQRAAESTIGSLATTWAQAYNYAAPHVALARASSHGMSQIIEELRKEVRSTIADSQKAVADTIRKSDEAETALKLGIAELNKVTTAAREAAKFEAVTAQSKAFDDEANEAKSASVWWMWGTIGSAVVSLIFIWAVFLYNLHPAVTGANPSTVSSTNQPVSVAVIPTTASEALESKTITASLLQQTIARVLIVTVLYSVLVWCARNYFASRHNFTVNRHRRNAMNTFRAFVEGTKDPATQDFILRQAAACAFSPQQSGYLKDESLPTPGPASQLVDMVKPGKSE